MEGQPLFDLHLNRNFAFDWLGAMPSDYKGLKMPHLNVSSVAGSFGEMVFQYNLQKRFSVWYNQYNIERRIKTHARLDRPAIELNLLMESDIDFSLRPFGKLLPRKWQYNLMFSTEMDSRVQFDSHTRATCMDIHIELELLEDLYESFPDLTGPFLEAVHAGRAMSYFPRYVFASPEMVQSAGRILQLLRFPGKGGYLLEFLVTLLLIQAMELKTNGHYCHMRYDRILQLRKSIDYGIQLALSDLSQFYGYDYYASACAMSVTTFKKYMRIVKGQTVKEIWRNARLAAVLDELRNTDKILTDISMDYGFLTSAAFRYFFKSKYGMSPRKVREFSRGSFSG